MHKRGNWGRNRRGGRGNFNRNQRGNNRPNRMFQQPNQLVETEVGITEYVGTAEGFSGVIKARFSDFHVNEIDLDGIESKFTETKIPEAFLVKKAEEAPEESPIAEVSQEQWDQILHMVETKNDEVKILIDVSQFDKEKRKELHKQLKAVFRQKIISSTVVTEENKFIEIKRFNQANRRQVSNEWPKGTPEYVHFLLYKESLDTMEAVMKISDIIRIPASAFNYAGVKDRRAKTTQWVSVFKVEPFKLLIKTKCLRNIHIGNLTFKDKPLKLGQLSGNKFRIALRNITAEDELVNKALEQVKENGFINYYGLQRFGNDKEVPTYEIGIKLLQGNWKEACNLILKPKTCEDPLLELTQAKKVYHETSDAGLACKKLAHNESSIESKLLTALAKSGPNEYVNALENIPRNMRLLYLHAFQSLIWNQAVSQRIKLFGLKPVVGDLVLVDNVGEEPKVEETIENETEIDKVEKNTQEDNDADEVSKKNHNIKILIEDDLEDYSIYDVVLPLPGYDIIYPNNELKDFYKECLNKHELELEMTQQTVKSYTLSGNYRKLMEHLKDLSWQTLKYNTPVDTLIRSDFEEILGHTSPASKPDGAYKGLVLEFSLPSSCYATMVLREILKMDTSSQHQAKLNNYHEPTTVQKNSSTVQKTPPKLETEPTMNENSLLQDKDKFEAFKKAIFEVTEPEEPAKRKLDDEAATATKKPKLEENDDSGIKTQASLV